MTRLRMNVVCLLWGTFYFLIALSAAQAAGGDTLTLKKAYQLALQRNEQVKASRQNVRIEQENLRIARSELFPELSVRGEWWRQKEVEQFRVPFPTQETNYGADLVQPLYQGGKLWEGLEAASERKKMAEQDHYRTRQLILFRVAQRYYGVLLARRLLEIEKSSLRRARDQLAQAEGRFTVGAVTKTDVLRNQVQVSESREGVERARNRLNVAREQLALELGRERLVYPVQDVKSHNLGDSPVEFFFKRALNHRQDYKRAQNAVDFRNLRKEMEESDWIPDFDMVTRYDRFPQNERFHGAREDWRVTLQGSYTLFSGFKDDAEIDRAESQLTQEKENLRRLRREIRVDVRTAYLNIKTQEKVIDRLSDQVKSARANYRQISAQFREGVVNSVDVTDAISVLASAESRLANARTQYQLDILNLRLAEGTYEKERIKGDLNS